MAEQPSFDELIQQAATCAEDEQIRELCALMCNALAKAFASQGARDKADGALACARAIRVSDGVEGLKTTVQRIVKRILGD